MKYAKRWIAAALLGFPLAVLGQVNVMKLGTATLNDSPSRAAKDAKLERRCRAAAPRRLGPHASGRGSFVGELKKRLEASRRVQEVSPLEHWVRPKSWGAQECAPHPNSASVTA